jgi:hypothetical protein
MFTGFSLHSKKYKKYGIYLKNNKSSPYVKKNEKVALFTNARDEPHIKEWAAHHLLLGFDYVFITDHLSTHPLTQVFKNFDPRVVINTCTIKTNIKIHLMNEAIITAKKYNIDWFIYLDADEFIILNNNATAITNIKGFLSFYNNADMIAINWLLFGSNYLDSEPDNILGSYTKSDTHINSHIKSFVRPNKVLNVKQPHSYIILEHFKFYSVNNNSPVKVDRFVEHYIKYQDAPAYIAHYYTQSEEIYISRKIKRSTDLGGFREYDTNLHSIHNEVENLSVKNKYSENIHKNLNKCT